MVQDQGVRVFGHLRFTEVDLSVGHSEHDDRVPQRGVEGVELHVARAVSGEPGIAVLDGVRGAGSRAARAGRSSPSGPGRSSAGRRSSRGRPRAGRSRPSPIDRAPGGRGIRRGRSGGRRTRLTSWAAGQLTVRQKPCRRPGPGAILVSPEHPGSRAGGRWWLLSGGRLRGKPPPAAGRSRTSARFAPAVTRHRRGAFPRHDPAVLHDQSRSAPAGDTATRRIGSAPGRSAHLPGAAPAVGEQGQDPAGAPRPGVEQARSAAGFRGAADCLALGRENHPPNSNRQRPLAHGTHEPG
jgi:hypothetical protein